MTKIRKVIKAIQLDYPNLDVVEMVSTKYRNLASVAGIAQDYSMTPYEVGKVLQSLQLRRKRKHRKQDADAFTALLDDTSNEDALDVIVDQGAELTELQRQLTVKDRTLAKQRVDLNRLRATLRTDVKAELNQGAILRALSAHLEKGDALSSYEVIIDTDRKTTEQTEGLVVSMSDWHIGEFVPPTEVSGGGYNYTIANTRIDRFIDEVIMYPKQSKVLNIASLGDLLKGVIHAGLYESEESFIASVLKATDMLMYMLSVFSEVYDEVNYHSITGNHDRVTEGVAISQKHLDYTRLIDGMLIRMLEARGFTNVNVITTDNGYILKNINGSNILMFHGDTVRNYKAYDSTKRAHMQDICVGVFGTNYTHALSGHTHSFMACTNQYGGVNIVNGCNVGTNQFGHTNGMVQVTPSQSIAFVNPLGLIEDFKAVDLSTASLEYITREDKIATEKATHVE